MYGFNPFSTTAFSELEAAQSYSLSADAGSYTITGGSATFARTRVINGSAGSYAITGKTATFQFGHVMTGAKGTYVITGSDAELNYTPVVYEVVTKGGLPPKRVKTVIKKSEHDDIAEIVKREFDKLDGTYVAEAVEKAKEEVLPQIKQITQFDDTEYQIALAQVNALLLQAKIKAAEYEAELDDETALLMLL